MHKRNAVHGQQGAVLVISLIFLLLMTIVGVTTMQTTTLQERMAGNARDHNLAFHAAEAALRAGEDWLDVAGNQIIADASSSLEDELYPADVVAWDGTITGMNNADTLVGYEPVHAQNPVFHVGGTTQVVHGITASSMSIENFNVITAYGVGGSANAVTLLRTTFQRLSNE